MVTVEDELPESVKKEMADARKEGEADEGGQDAQPEEEQQERVKLSRRAQKEEERKAELQAANERADKASQLAEQIRAESNERYARLEGMIGGLAQGRQEQQSQQQRPVVEDVSDQARKLRKEARTALTAGDIEEYEEKNNRASNMERDDAIARALRTIPQPQQVQRLPDWVTAVEAQFPDVVMHPAGKNAVAAFGQIEMAKTGRPIDPQGLMSAYTRAREELGIAKRADANNETRRKQLASGPSNGATRSGGSKETYVNAPKNYREIAKRAGMKPEDYLRQYAQANPADVSSE